MNEQLINELLEQLKSNLENVESAKQQVEETVGAYSALESQVDGFVRELGFITQNTRTIIKQLEEVKKDFLANVSTNIEKKLAQEACTMNSNIDTAKNEVLKHSNDIKTEINTSKTDLSAKITEESTNLSNKIDSVKNTIISDIQNTKNSITTALGSSEQKILQQVKEIGESTQTEISDSTRSIKQIAYWAIGLSFVTLCLVIFILTKL